MKARLKIAHKGVLLIIIALSAELIFLAVLALLLQRADVAIQREVKSKKIIYTAMNIQHCIVEAGTSAAFYKFSKSEMFKDRIAKAREIAARDMGVLAELVKDNNEQVERAKQCRQSLNDGVEKIGLLIRKIDKDLDVKQIFIQSGLRSERKLIRELTQPLARLVAAERVAAKEFSSQERRARQFVTYALVGGLITNILIAIAVSLAFFRGIAGRIELVIENTRRVPKNLPLNPPIRGDDEIAELDSVFHNTVQELRDSEEMRRMLIGMVSHDLRSPLTSVQAGLDLLGSGAGGNLNDMAKEILSQASADIARLLLLTDDLLDAEMLATGKIELRRRDFSVSDLIKQVTQTMNGFAESYEVTIDPVLPSEDFKLHADPDRLSQVLVNLLGNAIKFSAVGSSVSIECKRIDGAARFQVTDRGTGIESKHHATIFDRFIRLSNTDVSGKGLGLAICKSLVELHGGSIGVISSPGEGSTFWFTIALNE